MDLIGEFCRLELAADMFSVQERGVSIWWFIRQRAYALLWQKLTGIDSLGKTADSLRPIQSLNMGLGAFARGLFHPYRPTEILALSTSSARRNLTEDGRAFDVFFDFLSFIPDCDYAVMEFPDRNPHSSRPYSPRVFYGDWIVARGNAGRAIGGQLSCRGVVAEVRDRLIDIAREIGVKLSIREADRLVAREAAFVRFTMPLARAIIEAVRPKVVLVECGYAPSHMVVQLAAKRRGIPVIELQHGFISEQSIGYRFGIARDSDLDESPFPDILLTFGDHFKRILLKNSVIREDRIISTGYPYLWLALKNHAGPTRPKREMILITSQPGLAAFWADFALDVARKIGRRVTIKPHPAEMDRINTLFAKVLSAELVEIVRGRRSLYDLLPRAQFHLSVASTSHLEAIAFGVNDIVVSAGNMEQQFGFLKRMGLPFASNADEVNNIIQDYPDIERARKYVREDVFSLNRDPLQAIGSVIQRFMSNPGG
ncbi:MAG: hypothetical protein IMF26_04560 [Candidatus Fermentithermobacillus carboniphilus]|uniref:Capsule polysaccharide biosynthesis protein n=1 Tax=Candidatus Fermentithermobacillus carboniphilus TaxID=3085328 RepID=A0AAT9LHM6_9FIRM|nr:MAG: hypothetical protein IMF26_04560 [Candidatus Fermentithermobacillus carboniphilus]